MPYTVTVNTTYRAGCRECILEAERIACQGIRDLQVTAITLRTTPKCDHAEQPAPSALAGEAMLPGLTLDGVAESDTNGFDPQVRK